MNIIIPALIILLIAIVGMYFTYSMSWGGVVSGSGGGGGSWTAPSKVNVNNTIDNSLYFQSLNDLDLIARGISSIPAYISLYKSKLLTFTPGESAALDELIKNISMNYTNLYPKLHRIPWKFVKFNGIENDFPHTLGDIIFLPESFFNTNKNKQTETLIHEKIHVFQRLYPIETSKLITLLGYEVWDTQKKYKNIRTNPDTNTFIYIYTKTNTAQAQIYNNDTPKSITDSHVARITGDVPWDVPECIKQPDHPYEIMACGIANYIVETHTLSDNYKKNISEWAKEFL